MISNIIKGKMKKSDNSKFVVVLTVILAITSVISFGFFYFSAQNFVQTISGYATSTAEANLTVESDATVTFTTSLVSWGSGRVNTGENNASLNTFETNNVTRGNWTLQTAGGLRLQNNGNLNLTLNLSGTKTAAQMLGGTFPQYRWNISNVEAYSCRNATGGMDYLAINNFYDVNTTTTLFCSFLRFDNSNDSLRIDFSLIVPSDSLTGALQDTITATAFPSAY